MDSSHVCLLHCWMCGSKSHKNHTRKLSAPRMGSRGCEWCLGWWNKLLTPQNVWHPWLKRPETETKCPDSPVDFVMTTCKQRLGSTQTSGLMPWLPSETARSEVEEKSCAIGRCIVGPWCHLQHRLRINKGDPWTPIILKDWVNRRARGLWYITKWTSQVSWNQAFFFGPVVCSTFLEERNRYQFAALLAGSFIFQPPNFRPPATCCWLQHSVVFFAPLPPWGVWAGNIVRAPESPSKDGGLRRKINYIYVYIYNVYIYNIYIMYIYIECIYIYNVYKIYIYIIYIIYIYNVYIYNVYI